MGRQKLSPKALKAKRSRDLEYANSDERKAKRAENQRRRRAAKKNHSKGRFTSVKNNRGEYGKGTK